MSKSFPSIFLITILSSLLAACGGGDSAFDNKVYMQSWQSYSSSPDGAVHYWDSRYNRNDYVISDFPIISKNFKTGYAFVSDAQLIFLNLSSGEQFALSSEDKIIPIEKRGMLRNFSTNKYIFFGEKNFLNACHKVTLQCKLMEIQIGTFPYIFAEFDESVISITNWGDALLFDGDKWCRMAREENDIFICKADEPMVTTPRVIQFYSSIKYQGQTLLGEWPTGSIYKFNGKVLQPSTHWTPPPLRERERLGYEAQSMAIYCGDLFVGYWPKGEIWRFNHLNDQWDFFTRVFTDDEKNGFIPFINRDPDTLPGAFFGQRVTALVPYKDSLFVATSNSWDWTPDKSIPSIPLLKSEQYGKIHKIHKPGCWTDYPSSDQNKQKFYRGHLDYLMQIPGI